MFTLEVAIQTAVIGGICAVLGASLTALSNFMSALINDRKKQASKQIQDLCDEVCAYYELEKLYIEKLALSTNRNSLGIMREMRSAVKKKTGSRPKMSCSRAKDIKHKWRQ